MRPDGVTPHQPLEAIREVLSGYLEASGHPAISVSTDTARGWIWIDTEELVLTPEQEANCRIVVKACGFRILITNSQSGEPLSTLRH